MNIRIMSVLCLSLAVACSDTSGEEATTGSTTAVDGADGTTSADGSDGNAFTDGVDGSTATDETDGTTSTDAVDGSTTTDETDATDGTDGTDGADETDGVAATDETDGTAGSDETDETDGTDGADGTDETDSTDGTDGTDCEPGTAYCDQDFLVTCKEEGSDVTKCDAGCEDGACNELAPVCVPDEIVCQATTKKLLKCAEDGLSASTLEVCPHGCAEGASVCSEAACEPGDTQCAADDPTFIEICNADQTGFDKAEVACKDSCLDGKCVVPACTAGEQQCGVTGIEQCNEAQDAFDVIEFCKSGCLLTENGPVCAKCVEGLTQCNGPVVETCNDAMVGFVEAEACADIQTCVNGSCLNVLKLSGSVTQEENYELLIKTFAACFAAEVEGVCSSIDTSDIDYDITAGELSTWFCTNKNDDPNFESMWASDVWLTAIDVMGCGTFDIEDMTFEKDKIAFGESGVDCIAFDGGGLFTLNDKEIVVDACDVLNSVQQ